ncbi:Smg-4/UPF3 family-domain-containing protein [Mycena latifolia]|nr:Smg-4/UPF3 family-domain-containing protein [Mycena latifolia]
MSTAKGPPRKERERDKKDRLSQPPASTERLKTVVRRLPPNLPEDVFWQSVQTWVSDETVTWKIFYPGKLRKRLNKENIPSRAYIAFKTEEQLAQFSREYDGHLFRDKAGNESYAVVEFAMYQKVPPEKKKIDARSGTIEKDEDYISFLESLNAPASAEHASLESLIAANQAPPPPKTTPLLEALKAEKAAQKEKETAIRQIAQAKRDEAKKKNAAAPAAPATSATGAPLSKKAAKKAAAAAAAAQAQAGAQGPKPGVAGSSKPATQQPPPPNANAAPPRPPKGPKAMRQQQRIPGPPAVPTDVSVASAANAGPSAEPAAAGPAQRRTRPVIGLASRQFEAALSGAGVAGAGAGAEQRKSRRERERERAAASAAEDKGNEGGPATSAHPTRKDKGPARRKDSVSGGVAVSIAGSSNGAAEMRVPSILQRADPVVAPMIVHRIDGDVQVQPQAGLIPVHFNNGVPRGGGGGGRRGGRGGPAGRARGGVVGGGVAVSRGGG